jgi:Carboxypeptidase regulatory-like domain/TonB dependent receptor-like, beta-barrel
MKRVVSLVLGFLLLSIALSWAQQNTGSITGVVTDTSGALVTNGTVTIKNSETGLTRTATTNSSGNYTVTFLPPGTYSMAAEAKGFSKALREHVELLVGQVLTANFSLKLGASTETITITEEAPLIESTRSDISGSVSPNEVKELPIVDRNFAGLMSIVPGVRPAEAFDPTKTRSGNVSVNGSDGRSIDYNVDGGDNKDTVIGGIVQNFTMEGIQEFGVSTNRYTAESGRAAAAVVNVVSRSGTNSYHGSAFGLFQNSGLNANDFFSEQADQPKPKFHRYQFGGWFGGPIIKEKLFFMGAYEHKREPGDIPANPVSFNELSLFPDAQPVLRLPFPFTDHLLTLKIDHHLTDRQNMFYRYARERWINPNDQLGNPFNADLSQTNSDTNQFHDFVIQHNYTISNNKVNSINLHFQDFVNAILAEPGREFTYPVAGGGTATNPEICFDVSLGCGAGSPEIGQNSVVPQQTLIRKYQLRDDFTWVKGRHNLRTGVNWVYVAKMGGFFFFGANGYQMTFWENPSVILGDPARYPNGFATPGAISQITFNGGSGSTAQDPWHQLGFYLQDDFKVTKNLTLNLGLRWDSNINFLVPQLGDALTNTNRTVNALRQVIAANPTAPNTQDGLARAMLLAGDDDHLMKKTADWKEFQPRIGFAWDPTGSGRMVIRGGYGIARDTIFQNLTLFGVQQTQPTIYQTIIDLTSSVAPGTGACAGPLCTFRYGIDPLPAPAPGINDLAVGAVGRMIDPRLTDPWSQQMSIGVERQIGNDYSFSADYYHVLGTQEPRVLNMNPQLRPLCDPDFAGSNPADARCVAGPTTRLLDAAFEAAGLGAGRLAQIYDYATTNRSRYDGLNFQLKRRMSRHIQMQASYVVSWSNSWGGRPTSSYSGSGIAVTPEVQFRPDQYGPTIFDERHRFTLSGVFELPYGIQVSPLVQAASARPFDALAGADVDGDGRSTIDRFCTDGSTTPGCAMLKPNSVRGMPFFQIDLRTAKIFNLGEKARMRLMWEFYNLTNRQNFCNNYGTDITKTNPQGYCGGQGGPAFTGPFRSQYGLRFEF